MILGKTIPDFVLKDHLNRDFRLYENLNNWLVLIFYAENYLSEKIIEYNEHLEKLTSAGVNIVLINNASIETNKAIVEKLNIKFLLLSDLEGRLSKEIQGVHPFKKKKIVVLNNKGKIVYIDYKFPSFYLNKLQTISRGKKGS